MNTQTILIVDDETDIANLIENTLMLENLKNIIKVDSGLKAVSTCREVNPDVVILDIMLPDIDGYEVCRRIRQFSNCQIMFLSAKNDELDTILGLAAGGDDYVTKPFSPKELAFRVKAQLRRAGFQKTSIRPSHIKIGDLTIEPECGVVTKAGRDISLTAREFEILLFLSQNLGRVISRERLYEAIWKEDCFGCDNTIMVHIRHLREKIEDNPNEPKYIITMKGLGYKMVNDYEK